MLIPNHPDPERLSALASHDDDATADAALTSHVDACDHCTTLLTELGALRASLADLPDLAPSRPLQLVPPVPDTPASVGAAGWVRRLFAPMMTAGAAIAMVGLVGTTAPLLGGMASSGSAPLFQNVAENLEGAEAPGSSFAEALSTADDAGGAPAAEGGQDGYAPDASTGETTTRGATAGEPEATDDFQFSGEGGEDEALTTLPERSPWPMVLFTGVTLVIAALLLRWILVPRAG